MRYMRLVFIWGVLLYSTRGIGQLVDFRFGNGHVIIQDIKMQSDFQFLINTYAGKLFEVNGEDLYEHEVKSLEEFRTRVLLKLKSISREVYLDKKGDKIVVPHRPNAYDLVSTPKEIYTDQVTAKKIHVSTDSVQIYSQRDNIGEYNIKPWHNAKVILSVINSKLATLKIGRSIIDGLIIGAIIDGIILSGIEFQNEFEIQFTPLPKYIQLSDIVCRNDKCQLDLNQFLITDSNKICNLNIGKGVASQIKANYKYFNLVFDSALSVYDKERIYAEMMDMQKNNYFLDGYEKLDKEYKAFKYLSRNSFVANLQNWIDKHWWDYGYDKFMVIKNSVILFLLFFAINLLAYKGLANVYHPEKFKKFDERLDSNNTDVEFSMTTKAKNYIFRIPVIFLYTAFVFWGLKLDLKELEIKKPLYMTILIGQYIVGLVCLAYIANYIISK